MERNGVLNRSLLALLGSCLLWILTSPQPARADWSTAGAQYSCDTEHNLFELLPSHLSGDPPPPPVKPGFQQIAPDHPSITCTLGSHTLRGRVEIFPPSSGQCMGSGFVRVRSLSVKDVELLPDAPSFDYGCVGVDDMLTAVRVTLKDSLLLLERCYESSYPKTENEKPRCQSKQMNIDEVATANARVAHDLADPATQAAQAAIHLPPDNDFANVFRGTDAIPSCAHWNSMFQRFGNPIIRVPATTPHGRIAGSVGDRIYIHPANPQVCDANTEPRCKAKSYLIPGDRIDVGLICGQWTYVRYVPQTNATRPIMGWVETSHLYGIDSLVTPNPQLWAAYWSNGTDKDALAKAVANTDISKVRQLIVQHSDPAKLNEVMALRIAIEGRQLDIVNALTPSVDLKANCGALIGSALFTSQPVLDVLTRSGLSLGCYKGALLMVAGVDRIGDLEYRLSGWGSWAPLSDLPARARQLLATGIPVDESKPGGSTALFQTIPPNNVDMAQLLLKAGANPNVVLRPDPNTNDLSLGQTALIQAVVLYDHHLDPTLIRILLESGANPNFRTGGDYVNDPEMSPGAQNTLAGVTALHVAAEKGYLSISKLLLDYGADPQRRRSDGALPADVARKNHHKDVAALIDGYASRLKASAPAASGPSKANPRS